MLVNIKYSYHESNFGKNKMDKWKIKVDKNAF